MQATHIIICEHRVLTAVLHGMLFLLRHDRYGISEPNFELLGAMTNYIRVFPERYHHPKEDAYLFRLLRRRCPDLVPLLDMLEAEHRASAAKLLAMDEALVRYRQEGSAQLPAFYATVGTYAAFHYAHMRVEEDEVLPAAAKYLTAADWNEIDAAFSDHANPLLGAEAGFEYEELFRRIVSLTPAPLGSGPDPSVPTTRTPRQVPERQG
jgi:hemerythrin-like domain-containing protein